MTLILFFILCIGITSPFHLNQIPNDGDYKFEIIDLDNGSISRDIKDLTRDDNGFLWLVTDQGVIRFNGTNFILPNQETQENLFSISELDFIKYYEDKIYMGSHVLGLFSIFQFTSLVALYMLLKQVIIWLKFSMMFKPRLLILAKHLESLRQPIMV